uniref:XPGN domain-containing protein n=1 Tax=Caenorhabditis tropicalis TaxID=1561998 RepID=A0A1I7TD08_9PELO
MFGRKKLAIDVSIWIYQAQLAYPSDQPFPHLRLLVNRLSKLLFYKIRPVFVFDGPQVPELKRQVLESRRQKRQNDDDVLTNNKKMGKLKEIASGRLDDVALANAIKEVISPSKKVVLNDVYKDIPSTSTNFEKPSAHQNDQLVYEDLDESSSDDSDIIVEEDVKKEEIVNDERPFSSRKLEIRSLVEKRETMRNSRLRPDMIPQDSKSFSNFQMQRLLQRGRLNSQIEQLAKSGTTSSGVYSSDKINVTGPDGTSHVLKYAHSDEVQEVHPQLTREIDSLYQAPLEMTLDLFSVEYGGKKLSREVTPDDLREEVLERMEERLFNTEGGGYQSKSGMLEAIARKRVRQHYGTETFEDKEEEKRRRRTEEEEDDLIEISDDEIVLQKVLLETASKKLDEKMSSLEKYKKEENEEEEEEEEWDPQRNDLPSTSSAAQRNLAEEYIHLNYDDDNDKTPELYRDLQEFLTNAGIPWIEAPGEAEAQCVELERQGLVDGVVSDDSDVWAFGVKHVYRHMFAKNRRVQRYGEKTTANKDNCNLFCLTREDYVSIALLSGGDYSSGLVKVGAIGALELVSEFVECRTGQIDNLDAVERRIMKLLEKVGSLFLTAPDEKRAVSRKAMILRRHVTEANDKELIENVCSNKDAVHAYLHPLVDSSSEKFRWRQMNIPLIRQILNQRLQWPDRTQRHEEQNSFDAFDKWNTFLQSGGRSQMRLDRFFAQKLDSSLELKWSKKVLEAMEIIGKRAKGFPVVVEPKEEAQKKKVVKSVKPKTVEKKSTRGKGRGRGRGRGGVAKKPEVYEKKELNLSEESSNDSFDDF